MSDSLRDQLLQAGFSETRKKKTTPKKSRQAGAKQRQDKTRQQADRQAEKAKQDAAVTARRKADKLQIKALIDATRIEKFTGESVHRYILGTRIRELHVSDLVREKLNDGSYVITRLNGKTEIVPADTATAIEAINPEWAIVRPNADAGEDEEYKDFKVPDDLQW